MREWFTGIELAEIEGMPNSRQAVAVKAKRNNWLSRKVAARPNAFEYHISNFHEDIQTSLIVKFGTESDNVNIYETIRKLKKAGEEQRLPEPQKSLLFDKNNKPEPNASYIHETNPVQGTDTIDIPEFNVQAAAGAGCLTNAEFQTGVFTVSKELIRSLNLQPQLTAIVFCSGESMLPTMNDGDRILVDTRELTEPVKDGVYVIRIDEMVYVKRLKWNILNQSYSVISDNPAHDSFEMAGENLKRLKIIGRAAMVMRAL